MIKDGKYRYTLQFDMNTAEERQAGQFLEQLGNRKSSIIVAALNKYLEDNPELLDSHQVRILELYEPLIRKQSLHHGTFNEDLHQYLLIHIALNISKFPL